MTRIGIKTGAAVVAGCLLALGSMWSENDSEQLNQRSWLGPFAPIAAQVQWVRAESALQSGYPGRTLNLMESAVELDPNVTAGWISLADHLGLYLASAEAGGSMESRVAWLESALEVTRRGQKWSPHPEILAFHRGVLLVSHGDMEFPIRWGRQEDSIWLDAAAAFDEAARLHHPAAESAALYARESALVSIGHQP